MLQKSSIIPEESPQISPDCCDGAAKANPPDEEVELEAVVLPAGVPKLNPPVFWPSWGVAPNMPTGLFCWFCWPNISISKTEIVFLCSLP